jgi:hypothetical protein
LSAASTATGPARPCGCCRGFRASAHRAGARRPSGCRVRRRRRRPCIRGRGCGR